MRKWWLHWLQNRYLPLRYKGLYRVRAPNRELGDLIEELGDLIEGQFKYILSARVCLYYMTGKPPAPNPDARLSPSIRPLTRTPSVFLRKHGQGTPPPMPPAPADLTSVGAGWPALTAGWADLPRIIPREAFPHGPRLMLAPRCWLLPGSRPPRQGSHKPIPEPPSPLPPPLVPGRGMADSPLPLNVLGVRDAGEIVGCERGDSPPVPNRLGVSCLPLLGDQ